MVLEWTSATSRGSCSAPGTYSWNKWSLQLGPPWLKQVRWGQYWGSGQPGWWREFSGCGRGGWPKKRKKEKILLANYRRGTEPNLEDPFPDLHLTPQLGDACGPLLEKAKDFNLGTGNRNTIYFNCVRVMCKRGLNNRPSCVWSSRLGGDEAAPCWRTADLQWKILNGAIACNAIVCVFNPCVSNTCPFCSHPETVFLVWLASVWRCSIPTEDGV